MPELDQPRADAQDLALIASAWKSRVFFYTSQKYTLEQIESLNFFEKSRPNILEGNFIFINSSDGKAAVRVFRIDEETKYITLSQPD
jgi:hypothetical protein